MYSLNAFRLVSAKRSAKIVPNARNAKIAFARSVRENVDNASLVFTASPVWPVMYPARNAERSVRNVVVVRLALWLVSCNM